LLHHKFIKLILLLFVLGCARVNINGPLQAMRLASAPILQDDLTLNSLGAAIEVELNHLKDHTGPEFFVFGERTIPRAIYLEKLSSLQKILNEKPEYFFDYVKEHFDFYEVYGINRWGEVHLTSYYHSQVIGSRQKTAKYSQAIYKLPNDLSLTREEIDSQNKMTGKKMEICWLDPVDAFLLHVQGSGMVSFSDGGSLTLSYAGKNSSPYVSIGKIISERYPEIKIDAHGLEAILRGMTEAQRQSVFNQNPSYIFFKAGTRLAETFLGVPATAGRTIATDGDLFPKGALAFLEFNAPIFSSDNDLIAKEFIPSSRFVLDQDIGGAIKGPGRADLYWGSGQKAKQHAGVISSLARLYYLVPKDDHK